MLPAISGISVTRIRDVITFLSSVSALSDKGANFARAVAQELLESRLILAQDKGIKFEEIGSKMRMADRLIFVRTKNSDEFGEEREWGKKYLIKRKRTRMSLCRNI